MGYLGRTPTPSPVTIDDIPANSIDASKIVDGSIEVSDIKDNSITDAKLNSTKLDGIADSANNYTHPAAHTVSEVTGLQGLLDGKVDDSQVLTNVPSGALFTDTNTIYTHPAAHSVSEVTGLQGLLDGKTTETYVNTQITNVIGAAPAALDTLTELAAALGDDANFAGSVTTALAGKVDDSQVLTNVPSGALFTDTVYTHPTNHAISVVTGLQTALDSKLPLAGGTMTGTIAGFTSTGIDDNATSTKLATTATGINVTGIVTCDGATIDGASAAGLTVKRATDDINQVSFFSNGVRRSYVGANSSNLFAISSNVGSAKVSVDLAGNVGIGTTTPITKLDVRNNLYVGSTPGGFIDATKTSINTVFVQTEVDGIQAAGSTNLAASGLVLANTGGTGAYMALGKAAASNAHAGYIQVQDRAAVAYYNLLLQPNGGNVGIGTSSPSAKLDVAGVSGISINNNYAHMGSTVSGAMAIFGHNIKTDSSVANTVTSANTGYHSSMMKMYYNEGITFHTMNTTATAGDTFYDIAGTTNERMRIDSAGRVTMPYQPSASFTWSTHGFTGVFPATVITLNVGGHLASSGRFTAPIAGVYWVSGTWMNSTSGTSRVSVYKNGADMAHPGGVSYNEAAPYDRGQIMNTILLAANDYLELVANSSYSGIHQYHGNVVFRLLG